RSTNRNKKLLSRLTLTACRRRTPQADKGSSVRRMRCPERFPLARTPNPGRRGIGGFVPAKYRSRRTTPRPLQTFRVASPELTGGLTDELLASTIRPPLPSLCSHRLGRRPCAADRGTDPERLHGRR